MADQVIDATVFDDADTPDDESLVDVNGLLITHPEGGAIAGTGGYQPFLRQNNSDGSTQGFNTSDADTFKNETDEGLDMDKAWTTSLKVGDLPIVMIDGVAYYEIRLDLNEPNSGVDDGGASSILLELSEFQIYTSDRQATLADYTAGSGTVLGSDFDLVYDLDSGGVDRSLILTDGPSGSGRDDYIFYVPVSDVGTDPDLNFTLFAQFGPQPQEEATFEEFRIQNTAQLDGVKFNDLDGDGIHDANEDGLEGFVMYIDANGNDLLDTGEITAVSDADGNFSFHGLIAGTYVVREILSEDDISSAVKASPGYDAGDYLPPDGFWVLTTGVGGDHEFEIVKSGSDLGDATIEVGNHELNPSITIDKSADGYGDCADTVGETITYTVLVTNDGDTVLSNVVLKDSFEGGGDVTITGPDSGDGNGNGLLDPGETWTYTYTHEVNQDDIDGNGGGDGSLDNTATVTAESDQTDSTVTDNDDATVEVCQNPGIAIDKVAALDDDGECVDEDGDIIRYTYSVTNTGNVALDNVVVVDDKVTVVADDSDSDGYNDGDLDEDGLLDVTETWTYSASYTATQDDIDAAGDGDGFIHNTVTANGDAAVGGEAAPEAEDSEAVEVCQLPGIAIDKVAALDDGGECVDEDGDIINYTYSVTNTGNVALDNVVVVDDKVTVVADDADNNGYNDGDLDEDGLLDVTETWTYSASYTATQADIDAAGDGDGFIHNTVTANGDAAVSGEAAPEATDSEQVEVCQLPGIDIEKYVMTDVSGAFVDADDPDGPAASTSSEVDFKVVLTNTGNVTLTDVTLSDSVVHTVGGVAQAPVDIDYSAAGAFLDVINVNGVLDPGEQWINFDINNDGTLDIDENGDPFELSVGESVTIYYSLTSQLGQHENTVEVTTAEGAGDDDDANYFVLASDDCVGVRTPGFWANSKWMTFWDAKGDGWGTAPNEPNQAGTPGFADGELLYKVYLTDSNHDGVINGDPTDGIADDAFSTGLLIGDYNMNGITDVGEDTIFVSLPDAIKLINASSKQLVEGKGTADGIFMLGRDMVATWLNYLANNQGEGDNGNCIGTVAGATNSPREFLDAAIDWMQQFASTSNADDTASHTDSNTNTSFHDGNTQALFEFDPRVNPSSASWQAAVTVGEDIPVSGAAMHSALDAYNNTGAINGIEYCCDADSEIALSAIAQII